MNHRTNNWLIKFGLWGLLVLVFCSFSTAFAQSTDQASVFANSWYQNAQLTQNPKTTQITRLDEGIFVANFKPSGFLLFAKADQAFKILGYSLESSFPKDPEHPAKQLLAVKLMKSKQHDSNLKSTKLSTLSLDSSVEPLVSAKWGQGVPWNKFCPSSDGTYALVGCVAVAMSQIMHTWRWPEKGRGSNTYIPADHPEYGTVSANFDTTYYDWEQMDVERPKDQTALILFHAGVAINMNYGPNESGANTTVNATSAMIEHFGYHPALVIREAEDYSDEAWKSMLRLELVNGRPVIYRGDNPDNGSAHAFNIDGYHNNEFFHFNWGWDGAGNGYYLLEAMGLGGGNYTKGQAAIFGIQPEYLSRHDRPGSLQALAGDGFVQLFWEAPIVNDLSHYQVYRNDILIANTASTNYRDVEVSNGQNYVYHLVATYIGSNPGDSEPSELVSVQPLPAIHLPYLNDLETDAHGWSFAGGTGGFQLGSAAELGVAGNSGHVLAIRSDQHGAGTDISDFFTSPLLDLTEFKHVAISFDYVFNQIEGIDEFYVMYRRFDSSVWNIIAQPPPTQDWADWETPHYYLPQDALNGPIQLAFHYNNYRGSGLGLAIDNITIYAINAPTIPNFSTDVSETCEYNIIKFTSLSTGNIYHYHWDFGEGAEPPWAFSEGPHYVKYTSGGEKTAILTLNHLDTLVQEGVVAISSKTQAGFDYQANGLRINFRDTSKHALFYSWDFGDGFTSSSQNPEHKYHRHGLYEVRLIAHNGICVADTAELSLSLNLDGIDHQVTKETFMVFPNPSEDHISIVPVGWQPLGSTTHIQVFSTDGRLLIEKNEAFLSEYRLDINNLASGIYILKINTDQINWQNLIIKK